MTMTTNLKVENPTMQPWALRPVVQSDAWTAPDTLVVPAKGSAEYPITFAPKTMAPADSPHTGTVFVPYPNGSAKLFSLRGVAEPPSATGDLMEEVAAKTTHTVHMPLRNWLNVAQRFTATIERSQEDETVSLKGPQYIDVPALSERSYKLQFYAYKEGTTAAKVTMTNESTGEYLFYNVTVKAGAPASVDTLSIVCPVRTRVYRTVTITNPLARDVVLTPKCDHKQVFFPETLELKARVDTDVTFSFRPVVEEEQKAATLSLESAELGMFPYSLRLGGTRPGPERPLQFNVPLGSKDVQPFRFFHYLNDKAEYSCTFENKGEGGFESEPTVVGHAAGAEGIELEVEVGFEPTRLGENFRDTLMVRSADGGMYACPVSGRCVNPKPQGPVVLKANKGSVAFKNVFAQPCDFKLVTDNPGFVVSKPSENIPAKQSKPFDITFDPSKATSKTGKLIVTCAATNAPWLWYLRVDDGVDVPAGAKKK